VCPDARAAAAPAETSVAVGNLGGVSAESGKERFEGWTASAGWRTISQMRIRRTVLRGVSLLAWLVGHLGVSACSGEVPASNDGPWGGASAMPSTGAQPGGVAGGTSATVVMGAPSVDTTSTAPDSTVLTPSIASTPQNVAQSDTSPALPVATATIPAALGTEVGSTPANTGADMPVDEAPEEGGMETPAPTPATEGDEPNDDEMEAPEAPGTTEPDTTEPDAPQPESEFQIDLVFQVDGELDPSVEEAFQAAKDRWQQVIIGDLEDVELRWSPDCEGFQIPRSVDDIVIAVNLAQIDGPDGILGASAPCMIRDDGAPLPFAGIMYFDVADLMRFAEQERLEEIVLHEMGHVLGIGSLWEPLELLQDPSFGQGGADTAFSGAAALAEFDSMGGSDYEGSKVPVENNGGQGVANGHWRESVFGNELMTPYLSNLDGILSTLTIASLEDLGYEVSYAAAAAYEWPPEREDFGLGGGAFFLSAEPAVSFEGDILDTPIYAVDSAGNARRVR